MRIIKGVSLIRLAILIPFLVVWVLVLLGVNAGVLILENKIGMGDLLALMLALVGVFVSLYALYYTTERPAKLVYNVLSFKEDRNSVIICITNIGARSCVLADDKRVFEKEDGVELQLLKDALSIPQDISFPYPMNGGVSVRYEISGAEIEQLSKVKLCVISNGEKKLFPIEIT